MRVLTKKAWLFAAAFGLAACCPIAAFAGTDLDAQADPAVAEEALDSVDDPQDLIESALVSLRSCEQIGAADFPSSGNNRYRGDAFFIEESGRIDEFKIELKLGVGVNADLYFYVHKREAGETGFTRYWPAAGEEVILPATGTGQAEWYPSGPVLLDLGSGPEPLEVVDGVEYTFGVAWASTTITYYYDDVPSQYYASGQPFSKGLIMGGAVISITPPIEGPGEDPLSFYIWSGGAYSLELCFKPDPGACCFPVEDCRDDLDASGCLDLGGEFGGPLTECSPDPCPLEVAACCLPGGTCGEFTQFVCETTEGGVWQPGEFCGADPCSPHGACCVDDPEIICVDDVTEGQCGTFTGGIYRGDDSECDDFPGCRAGACCFLGSNCVIPLSATQCAEDGGVYQGDSTLCEPGLCLPTGACCTGESCVPDVTADECGDLFGAYRGDDTICGELTLDCGFGACCLESGCLEVRQTTCYTLGGTWNGEGVSCASIDPHCAGACCWGDEECNYLTPEQCEELPDHLFIGYSDQCFSGPCISPPDSVACCLPGGACMTTSESACAAISGTPQGAGSDCASADCAECEWPEDCDDGEGCTIDDCVDGSCSHILVDCDDGDDCTSDACGAGVCHHYEMDCDDGDSCTIGQCVGGACEYTDIVCNDDNLCTTDQCVGGDCEYTPVVCDDGLFCNGAETCDPDTGDCLDGADPCTPDQTCDENEDVCIDPPCPWDHNGDGIVGPADIQGLIAHFSPACVYDGGSETWNDPECADYDHNGDHVINPADIQAVIANFGPCP